MGRNRRMQALLGEGNDIQEKHEPSAPKPAHDTSSVPQTDNNLSGLNPSHEGDVWERITTPNVAVPAQGVGCGTHYDKDIPEKEYANNVWSHSNNDDEMLNEEHAVSGRYQQPLGRNQLTDRCPDLPSYQLAFGEEINRMETFCHLDYLMRFPNDHVSQAFCRRVGRRYFDSGNIYKREWDFFYIYPPRQSAISSPKALLLVPTKQAERLIDKINVDLGIDLRYPCFSKNPGFSTTFDMDGAPRPRYLGKSTGKEEASGLRFSVPAASWLPPTHTPPRRIASEASLQAFAIKVEALLNNDRLERVQRRVYKAAARDQVRRGWEKQIKRAQRCLGLVDGEIEQQEATEHALGGIQLDREAYDGTVQSTMEKSKLTAQQPLRLDKPAPFVMEDSVVFICFDVEAYERDHKKVTEVGFAVLDTADIRTMPPGPNGENWMAAIVGSHLRIQEYQHLKNKKFVRGCPDKFRFGKSRFIKLADFTAEIAACFRPPYTKATTENGSNAPKRQIILVGHDLGADIKFLRDNGYDISNLSNLQGQIDTASMFRAWREELNPKRLDGCLYDVGITGWDLHNAGNDAVYTMQLMIAICLREMKQGIATGTSEGDEKGNEVDVDGLEEVSKVDVDVDVLEERLDGLALN